MVVKSGLGGRERGKGEERGKREEGRGKKEGAWGAQREWIPACGDFWITSRYLP